MVTGGSVGSDVVIGGSVGSGVVTGGSVGSDVVTDGSVGSGVVTGGSLCVYVQYVLLCIWICFMHDSIMRIRRGCTDGTLVGTQGKYGRVSLEDLRMVSTYACAFALSPLLLSATSVFALSASHTHTYVHMYTSCSVSM